LKKIVKDHDTPDSKLRRAIENHIIIVIFAPPMAALKQDWLLIKKYKKEVIRLRGIYEMFRQIIIEGIEEGVFSRVDPKLVSFAIIGTANYTRTWYSLKGSMLPKEIAESIAGYFLGGIPAPN